MTELTELSPSQEYKLEMRRLLTQAAEQLTILNERHKSKKLYMETNDLIGRLIFAAIQTLVIDEDEKP